MITTTIRKKLMTIAEYVSRLAFWIFIVSLLYGAGLFIWDNISSPTMPLYLKLMISSFVIFLLGLFSLFLLDEEDL